MKTAFIFLFVTQLSFGQTFRNSYDGYEYFGGNLGQGYSFDINIYKNLTLHILSTAEANYLNSYLNMYEATSDKKYLDKFILHSIRIQSHRDDNVASNLSGVTGTLVCPNLSAYNQTVPLRPVWSVDIDNGAPFSCDGWLNRVLHSANLCLPMIRFVYNMRNDLNYIPLLSQFLPPEAASLPSSACTGGSVTTYADFVSWLECRVKETVQYHQCNWQKRNITGNETSACDVPFNFGMVVDNDGTGRVRPGGYGAYVHDCSSSNVDALNMQCAMGSVLAYLYKLSFIQGSPNQIVHCMLTDIALNLRHELNRNPQPDFFTWCHTYDCQYIEDIGHAGLVMEFAHICHQLNIPSSYNQNLQLFYSWDMELFANTLQKRVYQYPLEFAHNTSGTYSGHFGTVTADVLGGQVFLSQYNPYIYQILSDFYAHGAIYHISGDLSGYSQLALYQNLFNPIALQRNSGIKWTASAAADLDEDGEDNLIGFKTGSNEIVVMNVDPVTAVISTATTYSFGQPVAAMSAGEYFIGLPANAGISLISPSGELSLFSMFAGNLTLSGQTATGVLSPVAMATGNIDNPVAGGPDEIVVGDASGNLHLFHHNGLNIATLPLGNNFIASQLTAISCGDVSPLHPGEEIITANNSNKKIQVWSINLNNDLVLVAEYSDLTVSNPLWNGLIAGDFDGDGLDEILSHRTHDGYFFVLKIKNGLLERVGYEAFPLDQRNGIMCAPKLSLSNFGTSICSFRNFDGQISIFDLSGLCPGLSLTDQVIDSTYSIDNPYLNIDNNYPIDYHVNNTLIAGKGFEIQAPSVVEFSSGKEVRLKPGFRAHSGCDFRAYIDPALSCSSEVFRLDGHPSGSVIENKTEKPENSYSLVVSPNPGSTEFSLELNLTRSNNLTLDIYSSTGRKVFSSKLIGDKSKITLSELAEGLYLFVVSDGTSMAVSKVLVRR